MVVEAIIERKSKHCSERRNRGKKDKILKRTGGREREEERGRETERKRKIEREGSRAVGKRSDHGAVKSVSQSPSVTQF